MNPLQAFQALQKSARKVHVGPSIRRLDDGSTTEVDAYDREQAEGSEPGLAELRGRTTADVFTSGIPVAPVVEEPADAPPIDAQGDRRAQELAMWQAWRDSGEDPEKLAPLLESFAPLIRQKMSPYLGRLRLIPDSAIRTEFQLRFAEALRSYDPSKGGLSTHVYRHLDKAKRFITENQNVGRIPENRIYKIKQFQTTVEALKEKLDRTPSEAEIAVELNWPAAEVKRMGSELRADLTSQSFEEDPYQLMPSRSEEVLRLFKYELSGKELEVYEHLTGYGRKQLTSTSEIAASVRLPDYQVSRIKSGIERKLRRHLDT
jgi:DNA-directed RNA polymerase specialized sigma subunit